jgi:hypothetical protein
MSPVILLNSTNGAPTDTISGLATGTYIWHVEAVNGAFFQSASLATESLTVTGANAGEPGVPTLNPPLGATQFRTMETIQWTLECRSQRGNLYFRRIERSEFPSGNEGPPRQRYHQQLHTRPW